MSAADMVALSINAQQGVLLCTQKQCWATLRAGNCVTCMQSIVCRAKQGVYREGPQGFISNAVLIGETLCIQVGPEGIREVCKQEW